jgi:hypothetical protein
MPITGIELGGTGGGRLVACQRVTRAGKGEQHDQSEKKSVESTPTVCGA